MDPGLLSTCKQGDVNKLIKLFEARSQEFFLAHNSKNKNILHILSSHGKQACVEEVLKRLPIQLVCQADSYGNNPLHLAATNGFLDIAKLLVDAYKSSHDGVDLPSPPWIATNNRGKLPVQAAVARGRDAVAEFLLSVHPDFIRNVDNAGSLLFDSGAKYGCKRTAMSILKSGFEYNVKGFDPFYIMQLAKNCSENAVLLLERHPELFKCQDPSDKMKILRHATENNFVDIIKTIFHIDASISHKQLIKGVPNPLHYAARLDRPVIAHLLIDEFNRSCKRQVQRQRAAPLESKVSFEVEEDLPAAVSLLSFQPPWRQTSQNGVTPLHDALLHERTELAESMLLGDLAFLSDLADVYDHRQTVPLMENKEFQETTKRYLKQDEVKIVFFMSLYLETFLKFLRENPDKTKKLITQHPKLTEFKDASGQTILHYALAKDNVQIMSLILRTHPSAIDIQDENQDHLLIKACKWGKLSAIHAICAICPEVDARGEDQTTALHNVKLQDLNEYRDLLGIPQIAQLMNKTDALERSPLIKAILDDDIHLSEALTEMDGIDLTDIKSRGGKTAMEMLKDKSKGSLAWGDLYKKVRKANEAISFIPPGTDLKEMKNTLSVVAALLATITFAAGFTVPGGFDQNNGDVLLGRRASLIAFILSDAYAMCCSLIVLYSLIWSMIWETKDARALIGVCVYVLRQSLYGTLVAFMTGVYAVMSRKSLWTAIAICVMCSCVPVFASRRVLVMIFEKFVHTERFRSCRGLKKYQ